MRAVFHPTKCARGKVLLPSSKSQSNRALILQALAEESILIENLSTAKDTVLLQHSLANLSPIIDVEDAGTSMRFLCAFFAFKNIPKILTGSPRMQERPIGLLVDALREIGFKIAYLKNEGFPPLKIFSIDFIQLKSEIEIDGSVSSQFISALLLIAPLLPKGLTIIFTTQINSRPYLEMTLEMMEQCGVQYSFQENKILITPQTYQSTTLKMEADWSSASYFYACAALAQEAEIFISNLRINTSQADEKIRFLGNQIWVLSTISEQGILLTKIPYNPNDLVFDFTSCPDIAQTIIVICAAKNWKATFIGLESLRIKETDRIAALQQELKKMNVDLIEFSTQQFTLRGEFKIEEINLETYSDHRMAMAFAPLALLGKIYIDNPEVVQKSFPHFWEELAEIGFQID